MAKLIESQQAGAQPEPKKWFELPVSDNHTRISLDVAGVLSEMPDHLSDRAPDRFKDAKRCGDQSIVLCDVPTYTFLRAGSHLIVQSQGQLEVTFAWLNLYPDSIDKRLRLLDLTPDDSPIWQIPGVRFVFMPKTGESRIYLDVPIEVNRVVNGRLAVEYADLPEAQVRQFTADILEQRGSNSFNIERNMMGYEGRGLFEGFPPAEDWEAYLDYVRNGLESLKGHYFDQHGPAIPSFFTLDELRRHRIPPDPEAGANLVIAAMQPSPLSARV